MKHLVRETSRLLFIAAVALTGSAHAQQRPYAGQHEREIKALSADEVKQYLAGAGMGYAKSAELNHYPGPGHALELADKLGLTAEQRAATKTLADAHHAEARAIGARLVESEHALEQLFRSGRVDEAALARAVHAAAQLQGEYRLSHLETHRRTRALLTAEQVASYDMLRGYGDHAGEPHGGKHRTH
jgi:Spy/CpxP family protein refolding chaperone